MSRVPGLGVPGGRVSPHVPMGRATCPLLGAAALGAAQPCGVSLTTGGIAPASLRYNRLTPVARVAGPRCLAGDRVDCVPARLSPVASMAPGDVCHGPRCSLAGLRPAAMGYRPCCWPAGSAGSPECTRPMGCGLLLPVPGSFLVHMCVRCPGPPGLCSPVCLLGVLRRVCGVLGNLAPGHQCACSVCCLACALSWALGSCSPVCSLGALYCVCRVLGRLAPVHLCARSVCCVGCVVSRATWLLFTGVPARCVALHVRCLGPLGSCSPVVWLGVLCCVCGVLGHLAPDHLCARSVGCVACVVSSATWLLFTGVLTRCFLLCVPCPWPLGS